MRMFARHNQLKELEKLGDAELKMTILTRISDVITTYYDIVQQQQQLKALDTTIVISNARIVTAKNRYTIGKASKLEMLNAEVDLNTDTTAFLRQQELYANTKILLNQMLARDPKTDFKVVEKVQIDENLLLQIENAQILIDQQKLTLNTQLSTAYQTYRTNLQLSKLETKNEEIAKENMDITFEKFRIGTITNTTLEFRTAQINYINAKVRSSNAQFQAKISEVALKELAGILNLQ